MRHVVVDVGRKTQFNCTSHAPPSLKAVLHMIGKTAGRQRGKVTKKEAQSLAHVVDRKHYGAILAQDDLVRFMLNQAILLAQDSNTLYHDPIRSQEVLRCIAAGREPPPTNVNLVVTRIKELEASYERKPVVRTAAPSRPAPNDAPVQTPSVTSADRSPPATAVIIQPTQLSYVMYLNSVEQNAWGKIVAGAKIIDGQRRIGIPNDAQQLHARWATNGSAHVSADEYAEVVDRFRNNDRLLRLFGSSVEHDTYELIIDPARIHIVPIETRPHTNMSSEQGEIIRAIENGECDLGPLGGHRDKLAAWLGQRFSTANFESCCNKFLGYDPNYVNHSIRLGIWYKHKIADRFLTCIPGFEAIDFSVVDESEPSPALRPTLSPPPSRRPVGRPLGSRNRSRTREHAPQTAPTPTPSPPTVPRPFELLDAKSLIERRDQLQRDLLLVNQEIDERSRVLEARRVTAIHARRKAEAEAEEAGRDLALLSKVT